MTKRGFLVPATLLVVSSLLCGARGAHADTLLAPGGNFSGIAGYTYIKIVNTSTKRTATVTVTFYDEERGAVGSQSSTLAPGASWAVGSSNALPEPKNETVETGDFDGYVRISTTERDKDLLVFGAVAFPVDGSAAIGNALGISAVPLSSVRVK